LLYTTVLVLASWPGELSPGFLRTPSAVARGFFLVFRTRAVNFLFAGRGLDTKSRRMCVVAFGRQVDDTYAPLYLPSDRCHPSAVKHDSTFDAMVRTLVLVVSDEAPQTRVRPTGNRWITSLDGQPLDGLIRRDRSSDLLDPLSRYFCESRDGTKEVQLAVFHDTVDYRTEAVTAWLEVVHNYDCVHAKRLDDGWLTAEAMHAAIPDLPVAPVSFSGKTP
jgi:hypothetical protein